MNLKTHLELEYVTRDLTALYHSCSAFICHLNGIMMFARILWHSLRHALCHCRGRSFKKSIRQTDIQRDV